MVLFGSGFDKWFNDKIVTSQKRETEWKMKFSFKFTINLIDNKNVKALLNFEIKQTLKT